MPIDFSKQIDSRVPGVIRILIGAAATYRGLEARHVMLAVSSPEKLQLPFFDWLTIPSPLWVTIYCALWVVLGIAFCVGWRTGLTGCVLAVVMFIGLLLDQQTYSNHLYLLSLVVLLLSMANVGARYSIDAWRGRGLPTVPAWPLLLLKYQLSLVYFFGGVSKINAVYLSGAVLYLNLKPGGIITLPENFRTLKLCALLAAVSVIVDLALAFGLWLRRFRVWTAATGILFHLTLVLLLTPELAAQLAMFAVACISLYPLFFVGASLERKRVGQLDPRIQESSGVVRGRFILREISKGIVIPKT